MLSPAANLLLTASLTNNDDGCSMRIVELPDGRIGVWMPHSKLYDDPDGRGDSLAEALEDAAHRLVTR